MLNSAASTPLAKQWSSDLAAYGLLFALCAIVFFFYGLELSAGYCAVSYPTAALGVGLTVDPGGLSSVWVFASFGAWRNLNTIILEPCTGYRARLDEAIAHGSATPLAPGAPIATELVMSVLGDAADVAAFERAGGRRELIRR